MTVVLDIWTVRPAAVPRGVIQGIPRRIRRTGGNSADVPQLGARVGQALSEL